ncbi:MAG: FtsX-like permease family protein [Rhodanobacteraceae bacterium]|nr:MAG: FtsX-like permease family protein [Rhodanobacteraceae bacterium]
MTPPPILAALRKHKAGVFLIGLQIALTLAIVCNIVFIVGQKVERIQRPTGLVESDLFMISQNYIGAPTGHDPASVEKLDAMQLTDLGVLRALPDVQYATPINTLPLLRNVDMTGVSLKPGQAHAMTQANLFTGDQQLLSTLGLKLIAGRDFSRADVRHRVVGQKPEPPVVIVSRALADKLFPHTGAVGQPVYLNRNTAPSTIVGVVARILTANADGGDAYAYDAVLLPVRTDDASTMYAVRAKPGRMRQAMRDARTALFKVDPMRVIPSGGRYEPEGIRTFAQVRVWGYALDGLMVKILTVICMILLLVTGVGMAGLTSFWVNQRRKQIGIRRALGATRRNILHYFQIENLIIAGGGCVVGVVLAVGINLMLLRMFQMDRMPLWYVIAGIVVILLLGQLAVFMPARRAASVPPVVATRSV